MEFNEHDERMKNDLAELVKIVRAKDVDSDEVKNHVIKTSKLYQDGNREEYLSLAAAILYIH